MACASSSGKESPEVEGPIILENSEGGNTSILKPNLKKLKPPSVGSLFETIEEARDYFEKYAQQNGFRVYTRSIGRNRSNGEATYVQFVCASDNLEDERSNKRLKSMGTSIFTSECKANLRIKFDQICSKWKVSVFNDTHNHQIKLSETFHGENLEVPKQICLDLNPKNVLGGDINALLSYFQRKQLENPEFYYDVQFDEANKARNFFWVDYKSRVSYQYFGDAATFGLINKTNKYNIPFAPFIGVNHHMQTINFGCAIIQDYNEDSFKWLFKTWLEAMWGFAPKSIITNENLAIKKAINEVLPNTRHRLCIWNIMKQFIHKLNKIYRKGSKFKEDLEKCIWDTYKKEDFESKWLEIMKEFGLENNNLILHLYDIREFWVPVYNRDTFFAGMNTNGRTSGIHAFLNDCKNSNLSEFVLKYEQVLDRILERESEEDYVSDHKYRIVRDDNYLLKDAAKIYTRNIFNKFKDEMDASFKFRVEEGVKKDGFDLFLVKSNSNEFEKFNVKLNLETFEATCECNFFEFVGILCRHLLKVFYRQDIDTIPKHFILDRWRQRVKRNKKIEIDGAQSVREET